MHGIHARGEFRRYYTWDLHHIAGQNAVIGARQFPCLALSPPSLIPLIVFDVQRVVRFGLVVV